MVFLLVLVKEIKQTLNLKVIGAMLLPSCLLMATVHISSILFLIISVLKLFSFSLILQSFIHVLVFISSKFLQLDRGFLNLFFTIMMQLYVFAGVPGCANSTLLNGMSFVEGWEQNFFISKWSMHQLVQINYFGLLNLCFDFNQQCNESLLQGLVRVLSLVVYIISDICWIQIFEGAEYLILL